MFLPAFAKPFQSPFAAIGGFSPLDIPGLVLDLDADAITGLNDGDPITTWPDSSGQANDATQATASKKPILKLNIINGRSVVRFDGTDDVLDTVSNVGISGATARTLIVVAKLIDISANRALCGWGSGSPTLHWMPIVYGEPTPRSWFFNGWYAGDLSSTVEADTNVNLHYIDYDGTNLDWRLNGASLTYFPAVVETNTTNSPFRIGQRMTGDMPASMDISRILVYNSALSTANRQLAEAGMNTRYAIY